MVYIILAPGFEEIEALAPVDILRRAGAEVTTVGIGGPVVEGSHGIRVETDVQIDDCAFGALGMLVIPGGGGGVANIKGCAKTLEAVRKAHADGKLIGAICAGPTVLAGLGMLEGKRALCYPTCEPALKERGAVIASGSCVVRDGNIITAQAAGSSIDFGLALAEALFGTDNAEKVRAAVCYDRGEARA